MVKREDSQPFIRETIRSRRGEYLVSAAILSTGGMSVVSLSNFRLRARGRAEDSLWETALDILQDVDERFLEKDFSSKREAHRSEEEVGVLLC